MAQEGNVSPVSQKKPNPFTSFFGNMKRSIASVKMSILITMAAILLFLLVVLIFANPIADALTSWPIFLRYVFGIAFVLLFVGEFFLFFMILYLLLKRRFHNVKFTVEISVFVLVFIASWACKSIVLRADAAAFGTELTFADELRVILNGFYAAVGGLQFEGLPSDGASLTGVATLCLYYGTSIVAGLVFIGVIASTAAYEIYSWFLLRLLRTAGRDIFIFTALNDETLNLASSIVTDKRNNALVIFSGSSLEPFDRHNPECVEVMSRGYIYWSVFARKRSTILKNIGIRVPKRRLPDWASITIFAFDSDNDHIPNEEENMDYVLRDIHIRIEQMGAHKESFRQRALQAEEYLDAHPELYAQYGSLRGEAFRQLNLPEGEGKEALRSIVEAAEQDEQSLSLIGDARKRNEEQRRIYQRRGIDIVPIDYFILTKRRIDYQAYQDKIGQLEEEFGLVYRHCDPLAFRQFYEAKATFFPVEVKLDSERYSVILKDENGQELQRNKPIFIEKKKKITVQVQSKRGDEIYVGACVGRNDSVYHDSKELTFSLSVKDAVRIQVGGNEDEVLMEPRPDWKSRSRDAKPFTVHVWNEPGAIGHQVASLIAGRTAYQSSPKQTWVWSFGFGMTGQSLAKSLYSLTSNCDEAGKTSFFLCDAFDPAAEQSLAGLLPLENPMMPIILEPETRAEMWGAYETARNGIYEEMKRVYADANASFEGLPSRDVEAFDACLKKKFTLPCIVLHSCEAGAIDVDKTLQEHLESMGDAFFDMNQKRPDFITIAIGDDYANIRFANALIAYFRSAKEQPKRKTTILVNVWDEKNNSLVEGYNDPENAKDGDTSIIEILPNLSLIIVGNNEDIYRADAILDDDDSINYHRVYESSPHTHYALENQRFNIDAHKYFRGVMPIENVVLPQGAKAIVEAGDGLYERISEEERDEAHAMWRGLDLWSRESTLAAYRFAPIWRAKAREHNGAIDTKEYMHLLRIEHERWVRKHIMEGWRYNGTTNKKWRCHNALVPMEFVEAGSIAYDIFNVALGLGNRK